MARILDQYGRPVDTGRLKEEESAPSLTSIRQIWSAHNTVGMTPADLATYLLAAEQNDPYAQCEIFEEIEERDLHLRSVLGTRKLAVVGLGIKIVPPDNPTSQEQKITDDVKEMVENIPNMSDKVMDMLDGIGKGYSISEIIWGINRQKAIIEDIKWRQPKWFRFDMDTMTKPLLLTDDAPLGRPLTPYKYITHFPKTKSGIPVRGGLLRPCAWMYLFKNFTIKDWVIFSEVYGQPIRVGKYPKDASEKEKDLLLSAVANIGSDAAAIIPQGMMLEFVESAGKTGSADLYEKLARFADEQMSKGVLGQTTSSEAKSTGLGSGIARVHDEVRQDLIESDGLQLGATLTRDMIRPYVDLNHGPQDRYPRAVIETAEVDDLVALSTSVKSLHDVGLPIGTDYLYKKFSIPKPQEGDEVLPAGSQAPNQIGIQHQQLCRQCGVAHNSTDKPDAAIAPADAIADRADTESAPTIEEWLAGIEAMANQAQSLEELRSMLVGAFPKLPHDRLAKVMQLAITSSEAAGRFDVESQSGD